jgi:hypothetical protein
LEIREQTKRIATIGFVMIAAFVLIVVFGWVHYDFFGGEHQLKSDSRGDLERVWFGCLSGMAFSIIVFP